MRNNSIDLWERVNTLEISSETSMLAIRQMNTGPISQLVLRSSGEADKANCYKVIRAMVFSLLQFFGTTWNDFQVEECTKAIYREYYYWHLADLKKFMTLCYGGKYGKVYGFFNPALLMEWAALYDAMWLSASEEISINKANEYRQRREEEQSLKDFINNDI